MKFAPFAVACLLFNNTARFGLDLLWALAWFVVTVLASLAIHIFGVYSRAAARREPRAHALTIDAWKTTLRAMLKLSRTQAANAIQRLVGFQLANVTASAIIRKAIGEACKR